LRLLGVSPQRRPKFLRSLNPYVLLFSGWNWHANIFPVAIAAVKSSPYEHVMAITLSSSGAG
jgi:hypothetical protein